MKAGDKVVCVEQPSRIPDEYPGVVYPKKGNVYTVREFAEDSNQGDMLIRLVEIINPSSLYLTDSGMRKIEQAFEVHYFRPIDYSFGEKVCEEITKICEQQPIEV